MTIVEAMRSGLPVVSTDCPHGPASIIHDHEDGLLVPNKSVSGIAEGLAELMADDGLRRRMSSAALTDSERFDPANVVLQHERLFSDLSGRSLPPPGPAVPVPRPEPPASCRVNAGADGTVTLSFPDPPDAVALVGSGRRVESAVGPDGSVVVDAARDRLVPRTWEVLRVDGSEERPVRDVEIHQHGYPLAPEEVERLALVVPARSTKGELVLHTRRSEHHAEVVGVESENGRITVRGRVLGRRVPDADARMVVRMRASRDTSREFPAPVEGDGGFTAVIDPATVVRGREGESEKWELRLVLSDGGECTVGRHLAGVAGYKKIIRYPAQKVRPEHGSGSRVRPYYTVNDRLGLQTSPLAPMLEVGEVRACPAGYGGHGMRLEVRLSSPLPEGASYAVEVVRGSGAGQRFPLFPVPSPRGADGRVRGALPLPPRGEAGDAALSRSWRLRLLVGPAESLGRLGAGAVPVRTARRWHRGPYVRSVSVAPLGGGDLKVTAADVHVWEALRRRLP